MLDDDAPLYGMAQTIGLGPIPEEEMVKFLQRRARWAGKPMGEEAARLVLEWAGPVPNDVQHLAFEAFEVGGDAVDQAAIAEGMRRAVDHESALFAAQTGRLAGGQLRVLMELAAHPDRQVFSSGFARDAGLASGQSVKKAIDALAEDETLVRRGDRWVVGNPFLAAWLREAAEPRP